MRARSFLHTSTLTIPLNKADSSDGVADAAAFLVCAGDTSDNLL